MTRIRNHFEPHTIITSSAMNGVSKNHLNIDFRTNNYVKDELLECKYTAYGVYGQRKTQKIPYQRK